MDESKKSSKKGVSDAPPSQSSTHPTYYNPPPPYNASMGQNSNQPPVMMQPMSTSTSGGHSNYQQWTDMKTENSSNWSNTTTSFQQPQPQYQHYPNPPEVWSTGQGQQGQGFHGGPLPPPTVIVPMVPSNVPQGLAYLACLDRVFIRQQIELLEIITGCETKNRYKILDPNGLQIFYAKEDTDCCTRNCLGPLRPFDIPIKDGTDQEVIHLSRPFACGSCCYPCCLQSIDVESPPGTVIGRVEQDWTLWIPKYRVLNDKGECVLRIKGPCCTISCCSDVDFQILSKDGSTEVGKISKQWSGLVKEAFTDADNFGISFPMDLDVKMKAVMIGAALLIDFMFFEHTKNNNNHHD